MSRPVSAGLSQSVGLAPNALQTPREKKNACHEEDNTKPDNAQVNSNNALRVYTSRDYSPNAGTCVPFISLTKYTAHPEMYAQHIIKPYSRIKTEQTFPLDVFFSMSSYRVMSR